MRVRTPLVTAIAAGCLATAVLTAAGTTTHAGSVEDTRTTTRVTPDADRPAEVPVAVGVRRAP
ncbi:hypothetical protein [Streptomyces sp. NPDC046939]|uniref:hypothetical protein n=1 Tax=Streptomyces sp. NPDC046939 TaxID=3155376 RepID=UPI0033C57123